MHAVPHFTTLLNLAKRVSIAAILLIVRIERSSEYHDIRARTLSCGYVMLIDSTHLFICFKIGTGVVAGYG